MKPGVCMPSATAAWATCYATCAHVQAVLGDVYSVKGTVGLADKTAEERQHRLPLDM